MKNKDKCLGAYIGAAIGDAMGGPVECSHYARIQKVAGKVTGLLPYKEPYLLQSRVNDPRGTFHPGYALHEDAGSVTDDTFIRKDLTLFYLETKPPRTPQKLADWLLENAELDRQWPKIMVQALEKIQAGEATAEKCGDTFTQGGGIGWWTPVAIVHAGDPEGAAREGRNLSKIWKAPLERDLLAAVVAGMAEGLKEKATFESMVDKMFAQCTGSLSRELLKRAVDIAEKADDVWDLADKLYQKCLMPDWRKADIVRGVDDPLPDGIEPISYSDEFYTTTFFAEQIPLSLAAFVFAKGKPEAIPICVTIGRDCDSTATSVGGWVGALHGESELPHDWVKTVCEVNLNELNIRQLAEQICALNK